MHGQQQSLALSQPRHVSSKTGFVARNGVTCLVVMLYGSSTYEQRTVMVALAFTCAMPGTRSPSAAETTTVYAPGKTLSCGRTNTRIRAFVPGAAARLTFVLVVFCPSGSCHATRSRPSGSASSAPAGAGAAAAWAKRRRAAAYCASAAARSARNAANCVAMRTPAALARRSTSKPATNSPPASNAPQKCRWNVSGSVPAGGVAGAGLVDAGEADDGDDDDDAGAGIVSFGGGARLAACAAAAAAMAAATACWDLAVGFILVVVVVVVVDVEGSLCVGSGC